MVKTPLIVEDFQDSNWCTAKVCFKSGKWNKFRIEIINKRTEMRYLCEETSNTSMKGGLLATMGIPFYTVANVAGHVIRAVILFFSLLSKSIIDLLLDFSFSSAKRLVVNLTYTLPSVILQTIWSIAKAPICAIGMEFCAICVIVSPLTWRAHLGDVERFWRGTDRLHNLCGGDEKKEMDRFSDFFTNPDSQVGVFLAYCFQPWGSLKDSNIVLQDGKRYVELSPGTTNEDLEAVVRPD